MWGGVDVRRRYGDHFRQWSATRGLDDLRRVLYREPRPWYLAYGLHQAHHLLQDHHGARLLSWCTTVAQLRTALPMKREAFRYAQETFGMLASTHKVGKETLFEYYRLCAVGKDLTTAFDWHQFWLETGGDPRSGRSDASTGAALLLQYAWLLRIALESPSDESAEDMAVAVKGSYVARACATVEHETNGERVLAHFQPTTPEEEEALQKLFCAFKALERRLRTTQETSDATTTTNQSDSVNSERIDLLDFIRALPVSADDAETFIRQGWPTASAHCHNFPHLEAGERAPLVSPARPCLRDSLLSPQLLHKLETAAFTHHDASAVVRILKWYQEGVTLERAHKNSATRRRQRRLLDGGETELWRQFNDATAHRFRTHMVAAGGLTPELYHYVVCALAPTQPSAALRTLQRMREANMRVLDVTRAVALLAAQGSFSDQLRLFEEQLAELSARQKLDDDYGVDKVVEHFWKYEYSDFFHYLNSMDEATFYRFLMQGLPGGPRDVQNLMLSSQACGPTATEDDLVVLSDALRNAAGTYFRSRIGAVEVSHAVDVITQHMPKLDIAMVGSLPHFADYALADDDSIATDAASLGALLKPFHTVYVLDTSFVETSESFLRLASPLDRSTASASGPTTEERSLLLLPFVTLAQLGRSVDSANHFVSFDPSLQEAVKSEPFLASQRLRALATLIRDCRGTRHTTTGHPSQGRTVRVLHFTECLLAHAMPSDVLSAAALQLEPATEDNEHLLLVLSLLRSVMPQDARLVLCSDDTALTAKVQEGSLAEALLPHGNVSVLRSTPPPELDAASSLLDDNPSIDWDSDDFTPKLDLSHAMKESTLHTRSIEDGSSRTPVPRERLEDIPQASTGKSEERETAVSQDALSSTSPWLAMLEPTGSETDSMPSPPEADTALSPRDPPSSRPQDGANPADSLAASQAAPSPTGLLRQQEAADSQARRIAREELLMNLYESPNDVIPVGVKMREAGQTGSVFSQFDVMEPDEMALLDENKAAQQSRLQLRNPGDRGSRSAKKRRRSSLEKEMLSHRGASYKERRQMARQLSNLSGGRVPFNLRYRVVEANVLDPRNASIKRSFDEGVRKAREAYKNKSR